MTRRTRLVLVVAAIVLAALVTLGLRGEARLVDLVEVRSAPLTVTSQEEGKTRLRDRFVLSAPIVGVVRRVLLEQGDAVKAGQVVAEIEPSVAALLDPATRVRLQGEADTAREVARASGARVDATAAALRLAQQEEERLTAMPAGSAVSRAQLDAVRARREQAAAEHAAARAEQAASRQRQRAAQAVLDAQGEAQPGRLLALAAPVEGMLIRRHVESATPVAPGQPLLEFGDPAALEVEVEALSTEAVKLRPGMPARILRWGGDEVLEGRVARVEPGGYTKISALGVEEQRVRVVVELLTPRERWANLGDGYRVEVEFVLWHGESVLQVPSSALFRVAGQWSVFVEDGGRARRVPVEIGARGTLVTQIRSGLEAGQRVVSHPDDRIAEGVRLRSRD